MGSKALEAQRLRAELVGLRVAPWHVSFGSAIERGMEVHVHRVLLRSYWFLCGLDVHHQLHSLFALERVPGTGRMSLKKGQNEGAEGEGDLAKRD